MKTDLNGLVTEEVYISLLFGLVASKTNKTIDCGPVLVCCFTALYILENCLNNLHRKGS